MIYIYLKIHVFWSYYYVLPNSSKILTLLPTQLHVFPLSLSLLKQCMKIKTKNKLLSVCLSVSLFCMRVQSPWSVTDIHGRKLAPPQAGIPCQQLFGWDLLLLPSPSQCWDFFIWFELVKAWCMLSQWLYMHFKDSPTFWISVDKLGKTQVVVGFILSLPPRFWDYRHLPLQSIRNTQNFIELKKV